MKVEYCINCDGETGKAGLCEDSLYIGDIEPLCENCYRIACKFRLSAIDEAIEVLKRQHLPLDERHIGKYNQALKDSIRALEALKKG